MCHSLYGHTGGLRCLLSENGRWGGPVLSQSDPISLFPSSEAAIGRWILLTQQTLLATVQRTFNFEISRISDQ